MFARIGLGSLGGVSAGMVASMGETDGTIISSTLENRGDEMMAPVGVAVKRGGGFS